MCNVEVKERMRLQGVKQWEIAEYLGMSESVLSRKMRHELDQETREKVIQAIEAIGSPPGLAKVRGSGLRGSIDK